jgi:hypothetical protein
MFGITQPRRFFGGDLTFYSVSDHGTDVYVKLSVHSLLYLFLGVLLFEQSRGNIPFLV